MPSRRVGPDPGGRAAARRPSATDEETAEKLRRERHRRWIKLAIITCVAVAAGAAAARLSRPASDIDVRARQIPRFIRDRSRLRQQMSMIYRQFEGFGPPGPITTGDEDED
jgi:hypothetical protein